MGSASAAIELEGPPLPRCAAYVWNWYCELSGAVASSGMGPGVITHQQIEAWARLRRIAPLSLELDWLLDIDARRLTEYAERSKPGGATAKGQR